MHRDFRTKLDSAKGSSEFAIVANLDIRNFSAFSRSVESIQVAVFMRGVYKRLIDEYFPFASFYKPTGDGMLVIVQHEDEAGSFREALARTVDACLRTHTEFANFSADDPLVNFKVPQALGVGVARGSVTRISSGDSVLDYSGDILNLATRLMDIARPSGVVLAGNIGAQLLSQETRDEFATDRVYIRGISERTLFEILYTKQYTRVDPAFKKPIGAEDWVYKKEVYTLRQLKKLLPRFLFDLDEPPRDPSEVKLTVRYPHVVKGKALKNVSTVNDEFPADYRVEAGRPRVYVDMGKIVKSLVGDGVKLNMSVEFEIAYPKS